MALTAEFTEELRALLEAYAGSPLPEWELVAERLTEVTVSAGQVLIGYGEQHPYVYVVQRGLMKIHDTSADGRIRILAFCDEGQWVASVSALRPEGVRRIYQLGLDHNPRDLEEAVTGESRSITTALEPSTLARIDFQIIEELARRHLGWAQLLITYFYAHLLHVQADAYRMRFITPEQRYRSIVDEHPRWPARVKQRDLAAYLGVSEVGLSRIASRVLRSLNGS